LNLIKYILVRNKKQNKNGQVKRKKSRA